MREAFLSAWIWKALATPASCGAALYRSAAAERPFGSGNYFRPPARAARLRTLPREIAPMREVEP